ncbi:hypothetical protein BWQ96_04317 [Gracilariopsis chorda]|uniref:Uncharacterized protein n=1 Tax=Gracilariopsis chorda TaxID=448386 RepID=A0A2V3IUT6_9FLOR|nr:hypothetical protein BWQ96_04317 [Gracilariopsis chorda]|eukprot:PXF45882.1 hypothetical protein BWQ96_04317 [Gracilariopsis chorda]
MQIEDQTHSKHSTQYLPRLTDDGSNVHKWKIAIEDFAIMHDMEYLLAPEHNIPSSSDQSYPKYRKHRATLRNALMNSLPDDFDFPMDIDSSTEPHQIITVVRSRFECTTTADHQLLRQEAEATTLDPNTTIQDYVRKHRTIRTKMISAKFPNASLEATTLDYMIRGISANPHF